VALIAFQLLAFTVLFFPCASWVHLFTALTVCEARAIPPANPITGKVRIQVGEVGAFVHALASPAFLFVVQLLAPCRAFDDGGPSLACRFGIRFRHAWRSRLAATKFGAILYVSSPTLVYQWLPPARTSLLVRAICRIKGDRLAFIAVGVIRLVMILALGLGVEGTPLRKHAVAVARTLVAFFNVRDGVAVSVYIGFHTCNWA